MWHAQYVALDGQKDIKMYTMFTSFAFTLTFSLQDLFIYFALNVMFRSHFTTGDARSSHTSHMKYTHGQLGINNLP